MARNRLGLKRNKNHNYYRIKSEARKWALTDTGEDSKLVYRRKRPKVDTLFSSLFFRRVQATSVSQRRVENTRVHFWTFSPVSVKIMLKLRFSCLNKNGNWNLSASQRAEKWTSLDRWFSWYYERLQNLQIVGDKLWRPIKGICVTSHSRAQNLKHKSVVPKNHPRVVTQVFVFTQI